jgi:hypothetical protein
MNERIGCVEVQRIRIIDFHLHIITVIMRVVIVSVQSDEIFANIKPQ